MAMANKGKHKQATDECYNQRSGHRRVWSTYSWEYGRHYAEDKAVIDIALNTALDALAYAGAYIFTTCQLYTALSLQRDVKNNAIRTFYQRTQ